MGLYRKNVFKFSISTMIISVLVVFSLLGTCSLLFLSKRFSESALHSLADGIIERTISDSAEHVNIIISPAVDIVESMASIMPDSAEMLQGEMAENAVDIMIRSLEHQPNVYSVYYANKKGEFFLVGKRERSESDKKKLYFNKRISLADGVRHTTESWYDGTEHLETKELPADSYEPRLRPWYKKAVLEGGSIWTSPYIFYITKEPGITFARPIFYRGELAGVVAADLEIKTISDFLMGGVFTDNTTIFVFDSGGKIMAHSDYDIKYHGRGDGIQVPSVEDMNDPVMIALKNEFDISRKYGLVEDITYNHMIYKAMIKPYSLQGLTCMLGIYTPSIDYLKPFYENFNIVVIVSLFLLLVVIVLSRYVSSILAKPFVELSVATEYAQGLKFDKDINIVTNLKEVSVTQNNFNKMMENLRNYQSANDLLSETLHNAHIDTLYRLAVAAEFKDQYTYSHLQRVSNISVMLADVMGMSAHDIEQIRHASAMHDVGKLGIPDHILSKPGKLTVDEFDVIKTHSVLGAKMLANPSSEEMRSSMIIARSHHEKWDGTGYPDKLKGDDIPMYGRIVAVADVVDALLSVRCYKEAFSFKKTIDIVTEERGKHFDPELIDALLENLTLLKKMTQE